jgi:hypothetical protein
MYEMSRRQAVWVAEINVTACNSVGMPSQHGLIMSV